MDMDRSQRWMVEDGVCQASTAQAADAVKRRDPANDGANDTAKDRSRDRTRDRAIAPRTQRREALAIAQTIRRVRLTARTGADVHRDLFADPAWDMLLDLYVAEGTGRRVSVSDACIAAAVPQATALRWLNMLDQRTLVIRTPDRTDRRRWWVTLSDAGVALVERMLPLWMI